MVLGLGKQRCLPCAKALLPASPILRPAVPRLLTLSRNAPFFVNVTFFAFAQSHTANLRFFHNASFFHSRSRLSSSRSPAFSLCPPEFLCVLCVSLFGPRFSPRTLRLCSDIFALQLRHRSQFSCARLSSGETECRTAKTLGSSYASTPRAKVPVNMPWPSKPACAPTPAN